MADRALRLRELRNRLIPDLEARIEYISVQHARSVAVLEQANKKRYV